VARVAGTKDWKEIQCGIHNTTSFFVKIDSLGNITDVENDFGENPDIDELSLESPLYMGKPFKYSFDLYNYSDDNMMTAYRPTLLVYDSDSSSFVTIGEGEIVTYDLKPDEDAHLSFVSNMTVTEGYENYTGSVYFALKSVINGQINVYCTTVINEAPTEDVQLVADKFAVSGKAKDLTFDFTVSSKAGYYLDQFVVMVANPDENTVTILYTDDAYSLTAGNAISATVNDTAIHTVGTKYTAGLYYIDKDGKWDLLSELNFTMPGETTSIAAIAANNAISVKANRGEGTISVTAPSAIASVEGFALDGRKVSLSPAISGTAAQAVLPNGLTIIKVTLTDGTTSIAKVIK
jgi:hypothetical protein